MNANSITTYGLVGLVILWIAYSKGWIFANFESINAQTAIQMIKNDKNTTLLDVRTIEENAELRLEGATLIPVGDLSSKLNLLNKNKKIIVYCRSGNRSVSASRILESNGFTPINVSGGIISLEHNGAKIIRSKR